ncbi:MAG: DMSO reductase [Sneathiella sp.]|jgi:DMSO reductase anchor subunit|uniref:dimethyl sulfoxide reductase anchor subunit family protein n=1 Tax=Sneathiella sp. TaxID=1964365 RepID=UPI000C41CBA9|nr:DmsC/YnfH family molybdoenzyme membrane anchor subunit [Sneathiella sp.]MAL78271.1 DMSO reductase [Sneathiella sp.]
MHPAKSVIFFTTASGAGYGLVFLLIAADLAGLLPASFWLSFTGYAVGFALIIGGLLSSTFHLGHPERAWRALTQWRSSWLSREGVMAIFTFLPTGLFALHQLFWPGDFPVLAPLVGLAGMAAAAVTVYCTAMIYASLKPVHGWHNGYVPVGYLLFSLITGLVLVNALFAVFGFSSLPLLLVGLGALALGLVFKVAYWRFLDGTQSLSTPESATGLGEFGRVRLFEAPHTEANYLMQEMGFRIARKHAAKLRRIALLCAFMLPFLLTLPGIFATGLVGVLCLCLAVVSCAVGMVTERWLFFAEARHTVSLYYGTAHA